MIRRRLVIGVTAITALAVLVGGYLSLLVLEDRLIANLDRDFRAGAFSQEIRDALTRPGGALTRPDNRFDPVQRIAVVVYDDVGAVRASIATGRRDDPEPLPDAGHLPPGDGLHTVGAVAGDLRYRAAVLSIEGGGRVVVAAPMSGIDETLSDTRRILVVIGVLSTAAIAASSWWVIRRGLDPIDHMIDTADRIASGDLSRRTELADRSSEVGRLGAALDTMLDRIEEAVAESAASEDRMRRFVAEASHELRTPLTSVRGYAELYRQGADDPTSVALGMDRIETEALRMGRLVDQLLQLARLDQEPLADPAAQVDVAAVVGTAVDAVRVVDPTRTWELDLPDQTATVSADPDAIRQIVDNLLANARVHTPPGTTVSTALTVDDGTVRLVVSDDGPGVAPDDRDHVFDRFWRSTRTDENPAAGTGLGLAIVASLVASLGGTISLHESAAGGASFTVELTSAS